MRMTGYLLILADILFLLIMLIPAALGYRSYSIVSPSMAPAIPEGSMVYVKGCQPETVEEGEIIAFTRRGITVVHRVKMNDEANPRFITKGDANSIADPDPVPYSQLIGSMAFHLPQMGSVMTVMFSLGGKIAMLAMIVLGFILISAADKLGSKRKQ
ncbi:MAG: signal peptidase I [Erysipelotrichaceae bacterium]|nr:signal peptidase I [Erysipelotrichaceae bacterium]